MAQNKYRQLGWVLLTAVFISVILVLGSGQDGKTPAVFSSAPTTSEPPAGWVVECIECIHYFTGMSGNSAALDSFGLVHTAYGGDSLYYAIQLPDDTFHIEVVDPNPYRGVNATMVLDSNDRPHILYYAADLLRLNYAFFDGSQWQITTVPTADLTIPPNPWLVIDNNDFLHVVYNENDSELIYGVYDQNSWTFSVVDSAGAAPIGRPSLALDSSNLPHIAYAGGQKYGNFDGIEWQITTFTDPFTYGENAAIALDQNDQPHIAFQADTDEGDSYDLLYRYMDENSIWQWEMIETGLPWNPFPYEVGDDITLLFDAANQPTVTYTGSFPDPGYPYPFVYTFDLRMAQKDANGWQVLPRFNTSFTLYDTNYSTLISGPGDKMRIVLKDGPDMKLIKLDEDGQRLYYFIDRGGDTGTHNDLVVDNEGRIHSSHHEAELDHLRYGLKEDGDWTVQSLAYNAGYASSDWTSIALTSGGLPFVMFDYYTRPYDYLKLGYYDGQGWDFEYHLVNYDGYRFDLAVDRNNYLHTIYFPYNRDALDYIVRYAEDSWSDPIELDKDKAPGKFEVVLDSADYLHISYPLEDGLGYAVQTPTGWITDTITGGNVGDTSIALDKNNNPHIAWYDLDNLDLKYAAFDGNSWQFAAIDTIGNVGQYPDIAVDNLGRVYIAYYDATNEDLKYATFDGTTWTTTTLLSDDRVGSYASLAMPYAGYPAIAYYDAVRRDLMLMYRPFQPTNFAYTPIFSG